MGNRRLLSQALAQPPPRMDILYETLSAQAKRPGRGSGRPPGVARERRRVVVLWIDDTAVAPRWLSALAILLAEVVPDKARLRIIGPFKSDDLVSALVDDLPLLGAPPWRSSGRQCTPRLFEKNCADVGQAAADQPLFDRARRAAARATAGLTDLA